MRGINIIMALYVRDPLSYPVSDSIRKLTSLFCGDIFTAYLIMSNKRQRTKIIVSNEPVGKEWFIFYTPHCTKHNGYVCRFCPAGSKIYTQVKGAGGAHEESAFI